ncbi:VanZ family protein [Enterococcus alishanensis]|uniref:VanZ family protein n=1 Tax=Enterococcus alishanensis TaxID=1303817 RepID=A0ABS6TGR9_9ENTE|nr:VanZ family protein [Enterococcus alishanensis]MBV7392004.1 VanZ family protein [Enterococcus alishanensis]
MDVAIYMGVWGTYLILERKRINLHYFIWSLLLIFYLIAAIGYLVGFPDLTEWTEMWKINQSIFHPNFNLIPFQKIIDGSTLLNILFFIPLGVALPVMWPQFKRLPNTLLYGFLFSLTIEISQMFTFSRITDVNDLMMNTLGTLIGWLIVHYLFHWQAYADGQRMNRDYIIYPAIVMFCCFLI